MILLIALEKNKLKSQSDSPFRDIYLFIFPLVYLQPSDNDVSTWGLEDSPHFTLGGRGGGVLERVGGLGQLRSRG